MKIISISGDPIRKKWLSYYHEIEKKLSKLKRTWNAFENEAQAAYQQWVHQTFSVVLSTLNSLGEETHELRTILSAIDAQIAVNRLSKKAALEYVSAAMKAGKDPFPEPAETARYRDRIKKLYEEEFKAEHRFDGSEEFDPEILDRAKSIIDGSGGQATKGAIHELYEELKKLIHPKTAEFHEQPAFEFLDSDEDLPRIEGCKLLYRKIVKRLHPDRGLEMNRDERLLWSEAQRAYQAKDEEALRTILLRVEGGGAINIHRLDSIGELIEVTCALHTEYEEINSVQRRTKKEFVYRFWASRKRLKNREKLRIDVQHQLNQQLYHSNHELRSLKADLNHLEEVTQGKRNRFRPR